MTTHLTDADVSVATVDLRDLDTPNLGAWRLSVRPLLHRYAQAVQQGGISAAAQVFERAPAGSGRDEVDAAIAGLAEHLAVRDGWPVPAWALATTRSTSCWWWVSRRRGPHASALMEAPTAFRSRRIFVTAAELEIADVPSTGLPSTDLTTRGPD